MKAFAIYMAGIYIARAIGLDALKTEPSVWMIGTFIFMVDLFVISLRQYGSE